MPLTTMTTARMSMHVIGGAKRIGSVVLADNVHSSSVQELGGNYIVRNRGEVSKSQSTQLGLRAPCTMPNVVVACRRECHDSPP